jgi:5-methylcytosine-specific restriction enzyme A
MPRYFTHYWTNETWERERGYQESGRTENLLSHTASNQFVERGIDSGDFLYPVTVMEGALYVLGWMKVGRVCSAEEAASILGTYDLYEASDHAVAAEATPKHFDLEVPLEVIERLTFISDKSPRPKFSSPGPLDRQTLRGVRELEPRSAAELDKLLAYPRRGSGKERPAFEVGRVYNRRDDLHEMYGGQRQGGISTPKDQPFVLLFTGRSGEQYGYRDGWDENGVFLYTGEGQAGDMEFRGGNRAIRDHAKDGKDLHLFQHLGKNQGYRYLGTFSCSTWEFREGVDQYGNMRRAIVFHLVQSEEGTIADAHAASAPLNVTAKQLRERAYEAASQAERGEPKEAKRFYYEKSAAVREYVLSRAAGTCEACGTPAPFLRPDDTPYLEPHHTRRVSDGGPDHPRWVGAVCPNCHSEIHHGIHGEEKNQRLQRALGVLEGS